MEQIKILNYQGNKTELMPFISENISKYKIKFAIYSPEPGVLGHILKINILYPQMMQNYTLLSYLLHY